MAGDARVQVSIFGNDYRVRGEADAEYIRGIADYVDRTMKEIAAGSRQVSPLRIAILAAFNIADELHRERARQAAAPAAEEKAARLLRLFDDEASAAAAGSGD